MESWSNDHSGCFSNIGFDIEQNHCFGKLYDLNNHTFTTKKSNYQMMGFCLKAGILYIPHELKVKDQRMKGEVIFTKGKTAFNQI